MLNPSTSRPAAELAGVRSRLMAMVDALERRAHAIAATWASMSEEVFDELDRAQHVSEASFADALDAAMSEARAQLAHAIAVLDAGGYGVCEDCGRPIGAARLDFRPESTKCLDCQTASDRKVKDVVPARLKILG